MTPVIPIPSTGAALLAEAAPAARAAGGAVPFGQVLTDLLQQTQDRQAAVATELERIVTGEATGVHDLVVSVAEADLAFHLVMEIRDRLISSYHEIMRMQV